jgi:hypothetical protein
VSAHWSLSEVENESHETENARSELERDSIPASHPMQHQHSAEPDGSVRLAAPSESPPRADHVFGLELMDWFEGQPGWARLSLIRKEILAYLAMNECDANRGTDRSRLGVGAVCALGLHRGADRAHTRGRPQAKPHLLDRKHDRERDRLRDATWPIRALRREDAYAAAIDEEVEGCEEGLGAEASAKGPWQNQLHA